MAEKIMWGVSKDLEADVRYEYNACRGYTMDVSIGCPHHCVYCIFSQLEQKVYKLQNPKYDGSTIPMHLNKLLERDEFPPAVYLCYSSDPFGSKEICDVTAKVMRKLMAHNVHMMISTKGALTDEVIEVMKLRPDLIHFQMGMASADDERNHIVEPGAPTFEERLHWLRKVQEIEGIADITVRIDPMLPSIDDNDENVKKILDSIGDIKRVVFGYVILTPSIRDLWLKYDYLSRCANLLTERSSSISEKEVYSIPFEEKLAKLHHFKDICDAYGKQFYTCGCKDERFKYTDLQYVCHPFDKKFRDRVNKELGPNSKYRLETSHFVGEDK